MSLVGVAVAMAVTAEPGLDFDGKPNPRIATFRCQDYAVRVFKDFTLVHCRRDEPIHTFSVRRDYPNGNVFLDAVFQAWRAKEPISITYYVDPKDNQTPCDPAVCRAIFAVELDGAGR